MYTTAQEILFIILMLLLFGVLPYLLGVAIHNKWGYHGRQ